MTEGRNPIKRVKFSDIDYSPARVPSGFGEPKNFKSVTQAFREELVSSISNITEQLKNSGSVYSVAVVVLEEGAEAKSHRPNKIFNARTCPFLGDIGFGRLLIEVDEKRLAKLSNRILNSDVKSVTPQISTIKSIEPYQPEIFIQNNTVSVNIRLFRFENSQVNKSIDMKFEIFLDEIGAEWKKLPVESIRIYKVYSGPNFNPRDSELLNKIIQSGVIARITTANDITLTPMVVAGIENNPITFLAPLAGVEYPVVGVVDSGVKADCPHLTPWIDGIEQHVVYKRDLFHGSFVSGLISNAYRLNGNDSRFPRSQSKVVSVEVLDENGGSIDDILFGLEDAAEKYPQIRVWNLSLGSKSPVSKSFVSEMAIMLDAFQKRHNCLCVIAAGNYEEQPFRTWPPQSIPLNDGVSAPGDSIMAITVGSLAHVDGHVKIDEPSHFSRRGPVSNYMQKPEVVHYGGNAVLNTPNPYVLGVKSISDACNLEGNMGTSFSTPLVSTIAANLFSKIGDDALPTTVKALIIHSASLKNTIDGDEKHFYGWGVPSDLDDILNNSDQEITIVMEGQATKSFELSKLPFPIPDCMRTVDNKVRGEFFITLVYDPELNPQYASEYCQVNLNAKLGKIDENNSFESKVPLDNGGYEYERDLVMDGSKWSPVKVYKKSFKNGINVENWKLVIEVMGREGYDPEGVMVPFSLIITLRALDEGAQVYNEMSRLMEQHAWNVSNLVVESEIQV
jgi:hypothetical protein